MNKAALEILQSSMARRVAAAWSNIKHSGDELTDLLALCKAANVHGRVAVRWRDALLENRIIGANGFIDPQAENYIAGLALKKLPRRKADAKD